MELFHRFGLLAVAALTLVAVLAWPVFRHRRRTGRWPFTLSGSSTEQVAIGWSLTIVSASCLVWIVLYTWRGSAVLGVWTAPPWCAWVGWACLVAALVLAKAAQVHMGASWRMGIVEECTELVTHGVFRYSRNPIYAGILLGFLGIVFITPAVWTVVGWLVTVVSIELQARLEERHLCATIGKTYERYASRVGRFVPGIGRLR